MRLCFSAVVAGFLFLAGAWQPAAAEPKHAIAMNGEPALPADFSHFPYVNPEAPKGGRIEYAWTGTFDSVNPFIVQGDGARAILDLIFGNNVFDTLMMRSSDEPFTLYPLLAKTIETDDERSFVEFTLDERARFSDGHPVTPEDVIFTIELLRDKGLPRYGVTSKKISKMEKVGEHGLRITFLQSDRELPLILGLMPVLPKHATDATRFDKSTLKPMIGSGPYRLESVRPGDSITLRRNPDYWARDIPSKIGFDNYDEIRLTYFRDENAMFESFRKGEVDVFIEGNAIRWRNDYDFPSAVAGRVIKDTFRTALPSGMRGFVMNTRRTGFNNKKLREALISLFDFEWVNRNLYGDAYKRTRSFWDNSELSSHGRPASERERALLAPFPDAVTPEILANGWQPPVSDGSGRDRNFLKVGLERLNEAGYTLNDGRLVDGNGKPLSFEIMLKGDEGRQLALVWQQTLGRLGASANIRSVDAAQYQRRLTDYDFDVTIYAYPSSLSPGVEQMARWGSVSRDQPGTYNIAGVADPAVDAMIGNMLMAREREEFIDIVRAYDRVLMSSAYVVPFFYSPVQWVARWNHINHPETTPIYGFQLSAWWHEGE